MTARLRSDKGSFVQSPLKAFETSAVAVNGGTITFAGATQVNNSSRIDQPGGCFHRFDLDVGNNSLITQLDWTSPRTPAQIDLLTGSFLGLTSLTSWRLSDYSITQICFVTLLRAGYENQSVAPNGLYYPHVVSDDVAALQTFVVTNIGRHPGSPHPAFTQGEQFEWVPD